MYLLHSFIVGAIGKIIDDIEDLDIKINPIIIDTLKSITISSYTLISYNDFAFAIISLFISLFTYGIDTTFWKSFIVLSLFLSIQSYITNTYIYYPFVIFFIIIGIIVSNIEDRMFKEEKSYKKLYSRFIGLIGLCIIYLSPILSYLELWFGNIIFLEKIIMICIGGLFVSIISQVIQLNYSH